MSKDVKSWGWPLYDGVMTSDQLKPLNKVSSQCEHALPGLPSTFKGSEEIPRAEKASFAFWQGYSRALSATHVWLQQSVCTMVPMPKTWPISCIAVKNLCSSGIPLKILAPNSIQPKKENIKRMSLRAQKDDSLDVDCSAEERNGIEHERKLTRSGSNRSAAWSSWLCRSTSAHNRIRDEIVANHDSLVFHRKSSGILRGRGKIIIEPVVTWEVGSISRDYHTRKNKEFRSMRKLLPEKTQGRGKFACLPETSTSSHRSAACRRTAS